MNNLSSIFFIFIFINNTSAQDKLFFNFSLDYSYHDLDFRKTSEPITFWIDPFQGISGSLLISYHNILFELGRGSIRVQENERYDLTETLGFRVTYSSTGSQTFYIARLYLIDYLRLKSFSIRPFLGIKHFPNNKFRLSSIMEGDFVHSSNRTIRTELYDNYGGNLWSQFGFEIKATNRKRFYPSLLFGVEYAPHNFIELIDRGQIDGNPSSVRLGLSGINYFGSIRITI